MRHRRHINALVLGGASPEPLVRTASPRANTKLVIPKRVAEADLASYPPFSLTTGTMGLPGLPDEPRVVVSVTAWKIPPGMLMRCVRSVLDQSYRNLLVVVSFDGPDAGAMRLAFEDERLVCHVSERNHGPYFHHHLVSMVTGGPLFAVVDGDDFLDHECIRRGVEYLRASNADIVVPSLGSAQAGSPTGSVRTYQPFVKREMFLHWFYHVGAPMRVDLIEQMGGYTIGTRVGFDTLLSCYMARFAKVGYVPEAIYWRQKRGDSLSHGSRSGSRSAERRQAVVRLQNAWQCASRSSPLAAGNRIRDMRSDETNMALVHEGRGLARSLYGRCELRELDDKGMPCRATE